MHGDGVVKNLILQGFDRDTPATCQTNNSKTYPIQFWKKKISSTTLKLHLGNEKHSTDQNTMLPAEIQSPSKNACFFAEHDRKGKTFFFVYIMALNPALIFCGGNITIYGCNTEGHITFLPSQCEGKVC